MLKYLRVLLFLSPLFTVTALASDAASHENSGSLTVQNLQHEPIQPLSLPSHLDFNKVILGERLFNEVRLSRDNDMACASCHLLNDNGANHQRYSLGRKGVELDVNTPTVFNSSLNEKQFWDGRAQNLQQQVNFVVMSDKEFATRWPSMIKKLKQDKSYVSAFNKLYTKGITADNIRDAIATFEASLVTVNSRFDRFLLGDTRVLSQNEKKGYRLFKDYGCVACHQGRNVGGNLFMKIGVFGNYFAARGPLTKADLGRFNVTGNEADRYVFRVPSLRLVALTAPYFHDGSVKTLKKAIKVMAKHQLGRLISEQDIDYIEAFLKTLSGEYKGKPLVAKAE